MSFSCLGQKVNKKIDAYGNDMTPRPSKKLDTVLYSSRIGSY